MTCGYEITPNFRCNQPAGHGILDERFGVTHRYDPNMVTASPTILRIIDDINTQIGIADENIESYAQGGNESSERYWRARRAGLNDVLKIIQDVIRVVEH